MKKIGAAEFKARCLTLLDQVGPEGLLITKHGKPVAKLLPASSDPATLIGSLKAHIRIKGNVLTTGLRWHARS
jgi:prevent-host-death family protein